MADGDTFLQAPIVSDYILPFLLVWFIVFAILDRTKLLGDGKKQINALLAFVIGLIFVTAIYPKIIVGNLILFLTVAIVCIFVILLIWGFIFGNEKEFKLDDKLKWTLAIIAGIAFVVALVFATGLNVTIQTFFENAEASGSSIFTNIVFIVVIAVALALVLLPKGKAK